MSQRTPALRLLLDACVYYAGVTHHLFVRRKMLRWGNRPADEFLLPVRSRRQYRKPREEPAADAAPYLAGLAVAARKEQAHLFLTEVLWSEIGRKPYLSGPNFLDFNVFSSANVSRISTPLPSTGSWIMQRPYKRDDWPDSDVSLRSRIALVSDPRLREIIGCLNGHHIVDAYNIWSAEICRMDAFVTIDKVLLRASGEIARKCDLNAKILSPRAVSELHGVQPVDPEILASADLEARGMGFAKVDA